MPRTVGTTYTEKAANCYRGQAYDSEQFIRVRVLALTDYLYSLQVRKSAGEISTRIVCARCRTLDAHGSPRLSRMTR